MLGGRKPASPVRDFLPLHKISLQGHRNYLLPLPIRTSPCSPYISKHGDTHTSRALFLFLTSDSAFCDLSKLERIFPHAFLIKRLINLALTAWARSEKKSSYQILITHLHLPQQLRFDFLSPFSFLIETHTLTNTHTVHSRLHVMTTVASSRDPALGLSAKPDSSLSSHPYTCNTCQVAFRNSELQKGHMRSDWQ